MYIPLRVPVLCLPSYQEAGFVICILDHEELCDFNLAD